ncbi:MAG TPA: M20/M25/M40 family metallo-hydrolase [Acidimicrobiales bacterium]|nr:M20/M25/M40 family metallo-hydrolase [Acidimicrobiales bacterium]
MNTSDPLKIMPRIERIWEDDALATLSEYVRIPCLSPDFDQDWATSGAIDRAAELLAAWGERRALASLTAEIVRLPGRTPCVLVDVASTAEESAPIALIYGHFDKQPPLGAWREGLDPFLAVREADLLYGRGTADDGYAVFAALAALEALEAVEVPHGRVLVLSEASEESGSSDLEAYLDTLAERIGPLVLVVSLDSGCASYDRLWITTSLRGLVNAVLRVGVMAEGVHSGMAGGIVPSSFRVLRQLLDRLEDAATGDVLVPGCDAVIPVGRLREIEEVAAEFGDDAAGHFPVLPGVESEGTDARSRLVRMMWRAALEVTGAAGLPPIEAAGNVLRPSSALKISLRTPPTADAHSVAEALRALLTGDPPSGAVVSVEIEQASSGWVAPELPGWLDAALQDASTCYFGEPPKSVGMGGSIPFVTSLARRYPAAQFITTGVLGPESNAHGPDECLHVPAAKKVTSCTAHLLAALAAAPGTGPATPGPAGSPPAE